MIRYKFKNKKDQDFWTTLRTRVNAYFQENDIRRDANDQMIIKTVSVLSMYLVPYLVLIFAGITNWYILMALWIVMGMGKAFIGTTVMHDALHGSYFKDKSKNALMGFSATIIGVDKLIWQIQHNVLHHTYTNIEDTDEDILPRIVFRFSEHQPRMWFHRFQHLYAVIFYCVPLLEWITTKDFIKAFEYRQLKLIKPGAEFRKELAAIILRKIFYYIFFLAVPIYLIGIPVWGTVMMIFVSHCITGIMLAMIFQTAHVVQPADFFKYETENVEESWAAHQLLTTCNYGMGDKVLSWFLGGLNYQIEHHLFPDVCHIHYPKISSIVQETTKEFGLPYYAFDSFGGAVASHFKHLKMMGSSSSVEVSVA